MMSTTLAPPGLTGNLATIPLADLLQLISSGMKTGTLTLRDARNVKRIYFQQGQIISSQSDHPAEYLGQFLLSEGKLTEEQLRMALQLQAKTGVMIGKILVQEGLLTNEDLMIALVRKAEETILSLFLWTDGTFVFEEGKLPIQNLVPISLKVQDILLRGSRSLDDLQRMRKDFGSSAAILQRTTRQAPLRALADRLTASLYSRLDGKVGIPELSLEFRCSEYYATKALHALHKEGYIVVLGQPSESPVGQATPEASPEPAPAPALTGSDLLEQGEALLKQARFGQAIDLLRDALALAPSNAEVRELLERAEGMFVDKARKHLMPLHKIPVLRVEIKQLISENLTPEEGFLVSRINGTWDIKSIIDISPLREVDALRCLDHLRSRGVVELRDPPDSPDPDDDPRNNLPPPVTD